MNGTSAWTPVDETAHAERTSAGRPDCGASAYKSATMTGRLTCEPVAHAALGPPARKAGSELLWRCVNHDGRNPSLSVNVSKDVWLCGPCGSSGNAWQLAAFLAKVSPYDRSAVTAWLRERGLLNGNREIVDKYE